MATDGRKIRETRKLLGLKQQELAMQLGVSQGTVSRWEKNQQKPDFETMLKLAEMAGLPNPVAFARDHDEHQLDTMRLSRAFTVVGAISGNCEMGNCLIASKPINTMMTEITIAKTGL